MRRRPLSLEGLEERKLLAVLTNGSGNIPGDGQISVEVNEQGAFGSSPSLAVNLADQPLSNDVDDAIFNPVGGRPALGTTFESGLAIRLLGPGGTPGTGGREFLTAGTIGGTGNNINGFFLDPSGGATQSNQERNSRFFWPNSVQRPSSPGDTPAGAQLRFDLRQTLTNLNFMGALDGTALVQEYTIQNVSSNDISFELIRYYDGDLFTGGTGTTPQLDGGGERIFDVRRGVNGVHQTDMALNNPNNDPTFVEIQSSVTNVPRLERWEVGVFPELRDRIINGDPLRDDVIPTGADADGNDVRDAGADADVAVALRQEFVDVPSGGFVIFTSTTVFGHPPRGTVLPPPPQFGQVEGTKYLDRNGNGIRDPGEPGVPGFTIFVDVNQNGLFEGNEPSAITDQNGQYRISVPLGMHDVREVQQPFWSQSGPIGGFYTVDIQNAGDIVTGLDFGNVPDPGSISGVKFEDDNRSGQRDANEPGIAGVTVFLDLDENGAPGPVEPTTVTDAQGRYSFGGLEPGAYVVREIVPSGYEQTTPGGDGAHRVTINPGQAATGRDFGNRLKRGSILGVKWNDLNGDGLRTPDEPGVPNVIIYIDANGDQRFNLGERAAITNARGEYQITELLPGEYIVREVNNAGSAITFPPGEFHRAFVFAGLPTPDVNFGNRVNFDFGDAPDTYGTLLDSNGARHAILNGFHLGQRIDGEPNGQPTPNATGDDVNGAGFLSPVTFKVGDQPVDLMLADVTGDGVPDILTANSGSNNVSVARGLGDGSFGPPMEYDAGAAPSGVFAADFDNDGDLDLAVSLNDPAALDVAVLLNNGDGTFAEPELFPVDAPQTDVAAFDFDGDGDNDILVTVPDPAGGIGNVLVLRNVTAGGLLDFESPDPDDPSVTIPVGRNPIAIELGRIDGNALTDVVVVNRGSNSVSVLRNLGGGALSGAVNYTVGAGPSGVTIADFDDDGDRDLAVSNETAGSVTVLYNNGSGVFPNRATFAVPGAPTSIAAGHFDGQAGVDLAVTLQMSDSVAVLSNDGMGGFPAAFTFPTNPGPAAIASTLLDADAVFDILTANFGDDSVSVLTFGGGDEDGVRFASAFAPGGVTTVTVEASAAGVLNAWFDFNRDGVFTAADRVIQDASLTAGDNTFRITTPAGTADGPVFARFRLTSQPGIGPVGEAPSGEVEDYQVLVQGGGVPNSGHTNLANAEDVDGNGRVEMFDALVVVNDLRANGIRALPPVTTPPPPPPFLDVNGNGSVELNDLLRVIQRILIQQQGGAAPEPEGEDDPDDDLESSLDHIAGDVALAWSEN